jgi:hypothetical protein
LKALGGIHSIALGYLKLKRWSVIQIDFPSPMAKPLQMCLHARWNPLKALGLIYSIPSGNLKLRWWNLIRIGALTPRPALTIILGAVKRMVTIELQWMIFTVVVFC